MSIRFLPEKAVIDMHDRLISMYGGLHGIRDRSLLDSALHQPKTEYHYLNSSIFELAATYGFHICQNHPFFDGNKRTARMVMIVFLRYNGYQLIASEEESLEKILSVANGSIDKYQLSQWLKLSSKAV